MTDVELIAAYVADMQWNRLAETTIYMRTTYLNKLAREIGLQTATEEALKTWLSRPSLSPQSQNVWLTTLHVFYKWCQTPKLHPGETEKRADLLVDPTLGITKPKTRKGQPRPIPDDDLDEALKWATPLMKCWLLIGAFCGLRCQEIALIERQDIHDEDPEPWLQIVHGKGAKERRVPLHKDVITALRELPMEKEGRLWQLSPQQMSKAINAHLHDLGIKSTAHTLRHWYGTSSYRDSDGDIILVQKLMGHSSPSTTAIYADADMRKAAGVVSGLRIRPKAS
jgi:integrase